MAWATKYMIMHKDRVVASIQMDGYARVNAPSFMPYNLYFETGEQDLDARINNLNNFYYWCASRMLSMDRKYAKEILNALDQKQVQTDKDRAEIVITYRGLCLTDVYWIKEARAGIRYADINLYENSLSNAFVDVSLRGKNLTVQNAELLKIEDVAGDVTTLGVAAKAWVRKNGTFYLYKDGDRRDVKAELLASKIARCFDVAQVLYESDIYAGAEVSTSSIITNIDKSIVSMESIDIYMANKEIDRDEYVLSHDAYDYHMMNIIDYLVGNSDRHWGNWGFYVDNRTNKLCGLHPLMDFNKAFSNYDTVEGGICLTNKRRITQKAAALEAVQAVGINQIAEIDDRWFSNKKMLQMFHKRLDILRKENKK